MSAHTERSPQEAMAVKLSEAGIPYKSIECYGTQIVITSHSRETADRWAMLLGKFAKVRGVTRALDEVKGQSAGCSYPKMTTVWRTFAAVSA